MIQINIPMPRNCDECRFSDDSGDYPYCRVLQETRGYTFDMTKKKFPNCPLKPVEKPKEDEESARLKQMCKVLFNRCRVVWSGNGMMCVWCGMRKECDEMRGL